MRGFFLLQLLTFLSWHEYAAAQGSCPLNFSSLAGYQFIQQDRNQSHWCNAAKWELNLVVAQQLKRTQTFLFPNATATACLQQFQGVIRNQGFPNFTNQCTGFEPFILTTGSGLCANFTSVNDFRNAVDKTVLARISSSCQVPLATGAACSGCISAVVSSITYTGNKTCLDFSHIYAAGIVNSQGPLSPTTVRCLIYQIQQKHGGKFSVWKIVLVVVAALVIVGSLVGVLVAYSLCWKQEEPKHGPKQDLIDRNLTLERSMMHVQASVVQFTMDEIKTATRNFHRSMMIGQGGFGNVYKGILTSGTPVAVKRFKNCSPSGDEGFIHEVEMISSVRHRNLVPLLGWCIGGGPTEGGHQRMIVYEFMSNGSLYDQLFGPSRRIMDWPMRQRIALGTAKGLAYLHNGAEPAIIHRDIKGNNILLDDNFEARVSDFGLARFAPEGFTHMTTGVAGTRGYVAPEYVMYQQLTDRSDVYSFGIVFLELLTGKTALTADSSSGHRMPIADWAWSVLKTGTSVDILDQAMDNLGSEEVMERFILVALLCAHPQVGYRPSMVQVVKMLENDLPLPALPERPVSLLFQRADIDRITSDSRSVSVSANYSSSDGMPR